MRMNNCETKIKGRISEVHREFFHVISEKGETRARVKGAFYKENREFPVIGDYVLMRYNPYGDCVIEEVYPRKSVFKRPNQSGHAAGFVKSLKEQVLAANFDYVFIVASLNQNYNLNRIARYVTVTVQGGAKPVVILTKADLCNEIDSYIEEVKGISDQVKVCAVSAIAGKGMEELTPYLTEGITIALLGSSGVGKSTLVNAIAGEEVMKVSEIREVDSKGRHTTTHRQLIQLPLGVSFIDTPGIRELGMLDVEEGIEDVFSDIKEYLGLCKFSNCSHQTEPGCAIKQAIADNEISMERWKLYCQLRNENDWGLQRATGIKRQRDQYEKNKLKEKNKPKDKNKTKEMNKSNEMDRGVI